jgi:hypothetical protein
MKRVASSSSIDITAVAKSARTDEVPASLALSVSCFDDCPDLMIALVRVCMLSSSDQEQIVWVWRQVSKGAYASVVHVVRAILQPRLRALDAALATWKDAPFSTPFPFPEPCGPLPLTLVELSYFGQRRGARPYGAVPGETAWFRPFFVWAISYVLFPAASPNQAVDIAKAVADVAAIQKPKDYLGPAYVYFKTDLEEVRALHGLFHKKWSRASEHTPYAVLSTFSTGREGSNLDFAEPKNEQRFTRALLNQMNGLLSAIAFLLFWARHVTFETFVHDDSFLWALQRLVIELVLEWRCMDKKIHNDGAIWRGMFYLWFGDRPDTLVYDPRYLNFEWHPKRHVADANKREASQNFAKPEHRQCLIDEAMRKFDRNVAKAYRVTF